MKVLIRGLEVSISSIFAVPVKSETHLIFNKAVFSIST